MSSPSRIITKSTVIASSGINKTASRIMDEPFIRGNDCRRWLKQVSRSLQRMDESFDLGWHFTSALFISLTAHVSFSPDKM